MHHPTTVTGVVLAGGQASRMHYQDKGLIHYLGKPLISYALSALSPVAGQIFINANRNHATYAQFGWPVISDHANSFEGPLAGILSALQAATTDNLLVVPCDSPLISPMHLQQLLTGLDQPDIDIAAAFDGQQLHPVFLALKTQLRPSLQQYLDRGDRKIALWLKQHNTLAVDFSATPEAFCNINSLPELASLEATQATLNIDPSFRTENSNKLNE